MWHEHPLESRLEKAPNILVFVATVDSAHWIKRAFIDDFKSMGFKPRWSGEAWSLAMTEKQLDVYTTWNNDKVGEVDNCLK